MKLKITDTAKIHSVAKNLAELAFSMGVDIESILPTFQTLAEKELDERIKMVTVPIHINGKVKGEIKVKLKTNINEIKGEAEKIVGITASKSFIYIPFKLINFVI